MVRIIHMEIRAQYLSGIPSTSFETWSFIGLKFFHEVVNHNDYPISASQTYKHALGILTQVFMPVWKPFTFWATFLFLSLFSLRLEYLSEIFLHAIILSFCSELCFSFVQYERDQQMQSILCKPMHTHTQYVYIHKSQ